MHLPNKLKGAHEKIVAVGTAWQSYAAIIGAIVVGATLMAPLIRTALTFLHGWNWAAYALAGVFVSSILFLIITAGLALWRVFHPLPLLVPVVPTVVPVYKAKDFDLDERLGLLESRITSLADHTEKASKSFLAHVHLLMMREKEACLASLAEKLSQAPDIAGTDWKEWEKEQHKWGLMLGDWEALAQFYVVELGEKLGSTPGHLYAPGLWDLPVENLDAEHKHQFKTFRILLSNYTKERRVVADAASRLIFQGH